MMLDAMGARAGDARVHDAVRAEGLEGGLVVFVSHGGRDLIPGADASGMAGRARGVELRLRGRGVWMRGFLAAACAHKRGPKRQAMEKALAHRRTPGGALSATGTIVRAETL